MSLEQKTGERDWDWMAFVRSLPASCEKELALAAVVPGDRILIKTKNTFYLFTWKNAEQAELITNNLTAPSGLVKIMGCSFGLSSSIRPDAIHYGGNLEFTHQQGNKTWTTSEIIEIHLLHRSGNSLENS